MAVLMLGNLALIEEDGNELPRAAQLLREAQSRARSAFGASHPQTLELSDQLAGVLIKMGEYIQALQLLRPSLEQRTRSAHDHWRTFSAQSLLGAALTGLDRHGEAEAWLLKAEAGLRQQQKKIPANDSRVLRDTMQRIAKLYRARGEPTQALAWEQRMRSATDQLRAD